MFVPGDGERGSPAASDTAADGRKELKKYPM